jgi:DNA repair exonuclease SbcCD ATPase subunit
MLKYTRILSYVALILVIIAIYRRLDKASDLNSKINELERVNNSLQAQVDSTHIKIAQLDSAANGYKVQIQEEKAKLADLQAKADTYKQKYNEKNNRISGLTGNALVSEFTNAFQ